MIFSKTRNNQLRVQLLYWVWFISSLATFIFTSFQLFSDYSREENLALQQITEIQNNYIPSINKSLWDYNTNYLKLQLRSVENLPYVRMVELHTDDFVFKDSIKKNESLKVESMDLIYKNEKIGILKIGLDIEGIQKSFIKKIIHTFLSQAFKTLIVCFLLLKIFDKIIMRHLLKISNFLKKFELSDDSRLELDRNKDSHDELYTLVNSINELKVKLFVANKNLHELNSDLEKKVVERSLLLDEEKARNMHSAKLVSLGEMAGGIAHEINNPLAIISSSVQFLKKCIARKNLSDEQLLESILVVETTVQRVSKIIKGLRTVSHRSDKFEKNNVLVRDFFEDVLGLCSEKFKNHDVELQLFLDSGGPEKVLSCDRVQLSQVILNLLSNSFDAVQHLEKKWVRIQLNEMSDHDMIEITDSGSGISNDVLKKIFQPFFTSKEIGKGTGLGLSISKSIIEKHEGTIEINQASLNTCFQVKIPRATT